MASAPINPTQLTPPRVALIDERTGAISREWYRFFLSLLTSTQNNSDASDTQPDTNSLMATYDAMLASLAQEVQTAPSDLTGSLQQQISDVFTVSATQPRNELGTISYLQQDYVPWLTFANTPTNVPPTVGTMYWDGGTTLNIQMTSSVVGRVNESEFVYVKASAAITKGQLCYHTGAVGASGVVTAAPTPLALADPNQIIGVAAETIALNGFGLIQISGTLRGFNTTGSSVGETWADGDPLYYNPAYVGGMTKTKPSAPNQKSLIGEVINAGSGSSGSMQIRIVPGSILGGTDSNVQFGTLANSDLIQYDSALQYWKNVAPSTITIGTATNLAGGAANRIAYQTALGTTSFIVAPTTANTFLEWSGSAFQWTANPLGTVTSVNVSGGTTGLSFSGGPITTSGTITMAGTLGVANGGTGATSLTSGYLTKGNGTSAVTASVVYDDGSNIGIGTASPGAKLDVAGNIRLSAANPNIELNNGGPMVYAPAANTLGFATGGGPSSPLLKFQIGSSGQWGIGGATYGTAGQVFTSGGASAAPTWTTPTTGTVTSVSGTGTVNGITLTGTVTSSGSLTLGGTLGGIANSQLTNSSITINGSAISLGGSVSVGTVTSVGGTGTVNGITLTGTVTSSGSLTLGGTLSGVSLTTQVSGTLPVANGGTGATTFSSGYLLKGNGTSAVSASVAYETSSKILIGTTTGTAASVSGLLQVESEIISKGSLAGFFFENRSGGVTSGSNWYGWYNSGGTTYFYNPAVGNIASINSATGAYTALSDADKKKNFEPSSVGLAAVMALKPTLFHMNTDGEDAPKQLGFIAQDVQDHIPQAYVETDDFIGLQDRPIIAALVKAVQELKAELDELKR